MLNYENGKLDVKSFAFRGPDTDCAGLRLAGASRNMDLTVRGGLDVRVLEALVPELERTGGRVDVPCAGLGQHGQARRWRARPR